MSDQILQVGLYLGLIVGLIIFLGYVVKHINPQKLTVSGQSMKVVSSLTLGMKEKLVVVQVGDHQILLGVTPSRIDKIQTFEHPVIDPPSSGTGDFKVKLQELMQNTAVVGSANTTTANTTTKS